MEPHNSREIAILTIGVYGFQKDTFFRILLQNDVDTVCDIRLRRGMRGSKYSFANSKALQEQLQRYGIKYVHIKDLAPSQSVREIQKSADYSARIQKSERRGLNAAFIQAYERECLEKFSTANFVESLPEESKRVALLCVEQFPDACHRSVLASKLKGDLNVEVINITP